MVSSEDFSAYLAVMTMLIRIPPQSFHPAPSHHPGIPLSKLARQDEPILFFDEVTLFEDELHDNGVANLTVRIVGSSFLAPWLAEASFATCTAEEGRTPRARQS